MSGRWGFDKFVGDVVGRWWYWYCFFILMAGVEVERWW